MRDSEEKPHHHTRHDTHYRTHRHTSRRIRLLRAEASLSSHRLMSTPQLLYMQRLLRQLCSVLSQSGLVAGGGQ
jgi:hypothetical protein